MNGRAQELEDVAALLAELEGIPVEDVLGRESEDSPVKKGEKVILHTLDGRSTRGRVESIRLRDSEEYTFSGGHWVVYLEERPDLCFYIYLDGVDAPMYSLYPDSTVTATEEA